MIKIGGPLFTPYEDPTRWAAAVRDAGYRAAYCPLPPDADDDRIRAFAEAARDAEVAIAEVGAWSNPMSSDADERRTALEKCKASLSLADRIGARCCVNITGSRGGKWDGPSPLNLTPETFDMIVDTTREIIDAVAPSRAYYTLETMPWMYPDSAQSYRDLLRAVDRQQLGVHFDPVNLVCSPQRYFNNAALIREFVSILGPHIRSSHAKDTILRETLTVHLDETRPGTGALDYAAYLQELNSLPHDVPLMLEHLPNAEEYRLALQHVKQVAEKEGIEL